jgi:hypothetical protein
VSPKRVPRRVTPKEAQADLVRHVELCVPCQYDADACPVGKKLHGIWYEIAALAMREIFG